MICLGSKQGASVALKFCAAHRPQGLSRKFPYLKHVPREYTSQKNSIILAPEELFLALSSRREKIKKSRCGKYEGSGDE